MADVPSRMLAAILHADVVGSTMLVHKDEALAHQRIQDAFHRLSKITASYAGIAWEIRGDALVAEFSRASDAVCAALKFQVENAGHNSTLADEIRPEVRVGVSLGEVIIADGTVTGPGVVLAQRLEQLAEPGGVVVQGSVSETVPSRVPLMYEDLGAQELKGFEQAIRALVVRLKTDGDLPGPESEASDSEPRQAVIDSAGGQPPLELPDKTSIAVLPFTNMSGDSEQEYFSDGITEDIITELSRFPIMFVVARHSSFAFKGQRVNLKEVGKRLGVRYVVEGSIRRSGNRIRISAELADAAMGNRIWAERYDRSLEDIFDVQDEVTSDIVASLPGQIEKAVSERVERNRTGNVTAYEYLLRGNRCFHGLTLENLLDARQLYQAAINLDPHFARAIALLAATENMLWNFGWKVDLPLEGTMQTVQKALAIDQNDNWARLTLGWTLLRLQRFDEAEEQLERALALNPNDADCMVWIAQGFFCAGQAEDAYDLVQQSMRLNPLHLSWYQIVLGHAAYFTGRYSEALRAFHQAGDYGVRSHAHIAATCGQLGQLEKAQDHATKFVEARRHVAVPRLRR